MHRNCLPLVILMIFQFYIDAQVGINTTTPNAKAVLDLTSTNKGFLPPRMTEAQRNTITSPVPSGLVIYCIDCGNYGQLQVFNGVVWTDLTGGPAASFICGTTTVSFRYNGNIVTYGTVLNTTTNECWLDRNLGASQVATSGNNAAAYGDLFQWGRLDDGHQIRTSATTTTLSLTDVPGHGDFILATTMPWDWRSPQNNSMWQGVNGINNPCPNGYRIPTQAELDAERLSWGSQNPAGAFASPLKLTLTGARDYAAGILNQVGLYGYYRCSTLHGIYSYYLYFGGTTAGILSTSRAHGWAVRCIKD